MVIVITALMKVTKIKMKFVEESFMSQGLLRSYSSRLAVSYDEDKDVSAGPSHTRAILHAEVMALLHKH